MQQTDCLTTVVQLRRRPDRSVRRSSGSPTTPTILPKITLRSSNISRGPICSLTRSSSSLALDVGRSQRPAGRSLLSIPGVTWYTCQSVAAVPSGGSTATVTWWGAGHGRCICQGGNDRRKDLVITYNFWLYFPYREDLSFSFV